MIATPTAKREASSSGALVVFTLDDQEFGLPISSVDRVVRVVEITPLPDAPESVLGVINVQGSVIPVFNPRLRLHLPERALRLSDHLIIAHAAQQKVALLVDEAVGVMDENPDATVPAKSILPGLDSVEGIVKTKDDLILIHNLDRFLSIEAKESLAAAMKS